MNHVNLAFLSGTKTTISLMAPERLALCGKENNERLVAIRQISVISTYPDKAPRKTGNSQIRSELIHVRSLAGEILNISTARIQVAS